MDYIIDLHSLLRRAKPFPNCCFSLIIFYIPLIFGASDFCGRAVLGVAPLRGRKNFYIFEYFPFLIFLHLFLPFFIFAVLGGA